MSDPTTAAASIKSFTLKLDKVLKGSPAKVTMGCVYSSTGVNAMGIGYVLAVDDTITEFRCFNEGLANQSAFMNTTKTRVQTNSGAIVSYRLGFSDRNGELSGFMMQGDNGDSIVSTDNFAEEDLASFEDAAKA